MASTDPSLLARIFSPGPTRDDHPASGATGKAGRNLPQAITTAVVLIGIWELAGAFARMGITLAVTPLYVGAIGMVTCAWWLGSEGMLFALYITVFVCAAWRLLDRRRASRMSDVVSTTFTAVYVPFLASFVASDGSCVVSEEVVGGFRGFRIDCCRRWVRRSVAAGCRLVVGHYCWRVDCFRWNDGRPDGVSCEA